MTKYIILTSRYQRRRKLHLLVVGKIIILSFSSLEMTSGTENCKSTYNCASLLQPSERLRQGLFLPLLPCCSHRAMHFVTKLNETFKMHTNISSIVTKVVLLKLNHFIMGFYLTLAKSISKQIVLHSVFCGFCINILNRFLMRTSQYSHLSITNREFIHLFC